MRKKDYEQQLTRLLSKCENLAADLASAKDVAAHYKKEVSKLEQQLEQATALISDLTAQVEAMESAAAESAEPVGQPTAEPAARVEPPKAAVSEPAPTAEAATAPAQTAPVAAPHITAGVTPQIDLGAKAIGDAVFACTKFCNSATGELQRDLVQLALGKTEVFKSTVLSIIEGEGTEAEKQANIASALAEVLEYFEGLKQQEV